jgi:hypothetical protein
MFNKGVHLLVKRILILKDITELSPGYPGTHTAKFIEQNNTP